MYAKHEDTIYLPHTQNFVLVCVCRLNRLLHKHEFEEAETFAIEFGLGVEVSGFVTGFLVSLMWRIFFFLMECAY